MQPPKADPLRVSQTVKRMMEKNKDYETTGNKTGTGDFLISNKDQELVFSKDPKSKKESLSALGQGENEETEQISAKDKPYFKEVNKQAEVRQSQKKEDPILGLDSTNKDNQNKIPAKTVD